MTEKKLRITLVRSPIGNTVRQKSTVKGLGLGKLQSSVVQADTPSIRGMIAKVSHLVEVEEVES
jgi:large subunit ribosomal protein L30